VRETGRFFLFLEHGIGANVQDMSNITDPTPIERHRHNLLLHDGQTPRIGIAAQERPPTRDALLTANAFLAVARRAKLHHRFTLTMWTLDSCLGPRLLLLPAHNSRLFFHQQMGDTTRWASGVKNHQFCHGKYLENRANVYHLRHQQSLSGLTTIATPQQRLLIKGML
jgi:hypothetical protein